MTSKPVAALLVDLARPSAFRNRAGSTSNSAEWTGFRAVAVVDSHIAGLVTEEAEILKECAERVLAGDFIDLAERHGWRS